MPLTLIDKLVWAASSLLNLTLLLVLILRRRVRSVPWFTALIAFGSLRTLVLLLTLWQFGFHHAYFLVYWCAAGLDLLLQMGVVLEVAKTVFRRSSGWVPGARRRFLLYSAFAPVTALLLALLMRPAAENALDAWDARANVFMTVWICVECRALMTVSKQFGLGWKARVTRFTWGLVVWSVASFLTDTLHSYWRTIDQFGKIENTIAFIYQLVIVYWMWVFWQPEPERVTIPEKAKADLNQLTERLLYRESKPL